MVFMKLNIYFSCDPTIPLLGMPKRNVYFLYIQKITANVPVVSFRIIKNWKQPTSLSTAESINCGKSIH